MSTDHVCPKCSQKFKNKNEYSRHIKQKTPCINQDELSEKKTEDSSLKDLENFFGLIRNILRDYEKITGDKALDVITDFLFLRLLNYELDKNKKLDFITKEYDTKIKIDDIEYELDDYKHYFKWSEIMSIVKNIDEDSSNQENKELLTNVIQHFIFDGIFKLNDKTTQIYRHRRFLVKKLTTLIKLLKEFNKIEFDKYDVDVKGKAYELTIQKEGATNKDFSQFFTPRWIDKYMIDKSEFWNVVYKYKEFRVNRFHLRTYEFRFGFDRNNDLSNILYNNTLKDFSRMGGDGVSAVLIAYDSILLSIIPKGSTELTDEMDLNKPEKLLYCWQNLVFLSALHFGDNDTIGAIAGMLFGALRGFDGVSNKVLNMLEFKDEIKKLTH